ncbi:MAG: ROK family transcriptional regulator [Bacteroidetes bacterium]|nr:ROK family transcriptional regulator [Bacteroidota bacterium]MBU1116437.1 ROK family transcriptional regulator [Bacteroidota bacterium]MBU1800016.1 ROK family transcriptional regulator [Bacteroidota bacterium]
MDGKKLRSFDSSVVKDINEHLVLKLIQENEIISSSELVKQTGMRPSTIFNILKELSAKSFVSFYGKGDSTNKGGKKPHIWNLNREAAYSIGLDIEVGEMSAVVLDFGGGIVAKKTVKIEDSHHAEELVENIKKVVNTVVEENNLNTEKILGLGIAVAGIVNTRSGVISISSVVHEMNLPILSKLTDLPFPVYIENNANAAAIGLDLKNKNSRRENCITVLVEIDQHVSGLGIGIILNGEIYRGTSFCAGEIFTHMPTLKEILTNFRSRFHESEYLREYSSNVEDIDIKILLNAAKNEDKIAQQIFTVIGSIVGQIIAPAIGLLNPKSLVITGVIAELDELIIQSVRREIELKAISFANNALSIEVDKHHQYSVSVGAAALVLGKFFRMPSLG